MERAFAHRAAGDLVAAAIELKSALQIEPKNAAARLALGHVYLELGDGAAAAKEFRQAIASGQSSRETEIGLLRSRLLSGEYAEVLEGLSWLDEDDPEVRARERRSAARAATAR